MYIIIGLLRDYRFPKQVIRPTKLPTLSRMRNEQGRSGIAPSMCLTVCGVAQGREIAPTTINFTRLSVTVGVAGWVWSLHGKQT